MDYEMDTSWVRESLRPAESVLWTGKPGKGHLITKETVFLLFFSLIWIGFSMVWIVMMIQSESAPFAVFGVVFLLLGCSISLLPILIQWIRRGKTLYALTSQRLIQKVGDKVKSMELTELPPMTTVSYADGSGTIRFGGSSAAQGSFGMYNSRTVWMQPAFELTNIPEAGQVAYRIRIAIQQAQSANE